MGVLGVDDRSPGELVPPEDPNVNTRAEFFAARLNRDIGKLSDVGLIYADREYVGSFNRAGGIDYRARVGKGWTLTGQAVTSPDTEPQRLHSPGEQECEELTTSPAAARPGSSKPATPICIGAGGSHYHDTASGFCDQHGILPAA